VDLDAGCLQGRQIGSLLTRWSSGQTVDYRQKAAAINANGELC
jgi:hypothetical protein